MEDNSTTTLFLLNSFTAGGSEIKAIRIANALAAEGRSVCIAYLTDPNTIGSNVHPAVHVTFICRRSHFDKVALQKYRNIFRTFKISNVIAMNLYPILFHTLARIKEEVSLHVSVNTTEFLTLKDKLSMVIYRRLLKNTTSIIYGCHHQKDIWSTKYSLDNTASRVIYNGVDVVRFSPVSYDEYQRLRADIGLNPDMLAICMVAQFRPEKCHSDLLRAVAVLASQGFPIHTVFVGTGEKEQECKQLAMSLGIENKVSFFGFQDDVWPILGAIDVFVLTSRSVETFSNAALEAMAMGKPAILSDVGGAKEMVFNAVNGFTYPAGNIEQLTLKIKMLTDQRLRKSMGEAARALTEEKFSFSKMIDAYKKIIYTF